MKKLEDLFEHQLKDLYSAESQLVKALPKMAKAANDEKLKKAFEDHLEETKEHKKRLEEVSKDLGFKPTGEECKAMKGLIEEAESFLKEDAEDDVRDAGLIADAIATAVSTAMADYVPYARQANYRALASMPYGKYHPEHNQDQNVQFVDHVPEDANPEEAL